MLRLRSGSALERLLGHRFRRPELLEMALTHRSHTHESGVGENYERLEFLGDAVLGMLAAEWLYAERPGLPEGDLSKLKSYLVSREVLAQRAASLGLGEELRLGVGEERSGGRGKASLLADVMESVIGAVYLDGGLEGARKVVRPLLEEGLALREREKVDPKTRLQELSQARGWDLPAYHLAEESGPDHAKLFTVECRLRGELAGSGSGRSKKVAEQAAAAAALLAVASLEAGGAAEGAEPGTTRATTLRHPRPVPRIAGSMTDRDPTSQLPAPGIRHLAAHAGEEVVVRGWVETKRSSGKIAFVQVRDGSGTVQAVASRADVPEAAWEAVERLTQESTVEVTGRVKEDRRAPSGVELQLTDLALIHLTEDYPITPKEHGTAFLMEHRHLWLRSSRQRAVLAVRNEAEQAIRDFFYRREYTLIDSPILTPAACEGTSTLFETDYFGEPAYLSQSGQLYLEPAAAAFGKVYCFGPTFRAEKSKTRRHLMEFWMVEPEVAFLEFDGLLALAEEFLTEIVGRVRERCDEPLKVLERDPAKLERIQGPFPRITYGEAIEILREKGAEIAWGDDLGGDEETMLAEHFERPVMVHRYPAAMKAFYMQPDPEDPKLALAVDVLAPEGYGEIIGGSQRIHDHDLLLARIREHELPVEAFQWYLDVRKYGAFPHSGFGMGIERFVAWMCGVPHLRETIPYPRMLYRIYP